MKKMLKLKLSVFIGLIFLAGCKQSNYDQIKSYIDTIKTVDTHSHMGTPWKKNHNCFDLGLYLNADLISAGMQEFPDSIVESSDPEKYWEHAEEYLRFCRATTYYSQFIYDFRMLYDFDSLYLGKDDFLKFSEKIDSNFKNYQSWLDSGFKKCNFEVMFADRLWQIFDTHFDTSYFRYVFRVDQLVLEALDAAKAKRITNNQALDFLGKEEIPVPNLDSYLEYIDSIMMKLVGHNVVSLKVGLAYHRSLDVKPVDRVDAQRIFMSPFQNKEEITQLQDYIIDYIANRAPDYSLPVQIHTGYLHGTGGTIDNGQPLKLIPLIKANPRTKFVLFHGSYPWTGDFIAMGKHYPNVYLDIVWLPQISRTAAIRTLHELLDCVPYNKLFWGSDVGLIDDAAGSVELGREVFATVLAERVDNGWMTMDVAKDIARRVFRENAIEFFALAGHRG